MWAAIERRSRQYLKTYLREEHDIFTITEGIAENVNNSAIYLDRKWRKTLSGLESGKWDTALLGALINASYARLYQRVMGQLGVSMQDPFVQGDDGVTNTSSMVGAATLLTVVNASGNEVNAKKSIITYPLYQTRDRKASFSEFLRKTVYRDRVVGYPGRAIRAIFERNPISQSKLDLREVLSGIVSRWMNIASRGATKEWRGYMVSDCMGATGLGRDEITQLLHTPVAMGGIGAFQYEGGRMLSLEYAQ